MITRTGNTQTERTKTGIITTAEEVVTKRNKKSYTRWVQIGYVSLERNKNNKLVATGAYGQQLINKEGK